MGASACAMGDDRLRAGLLEEGEIAVEDRRRRFYPQSCCTAPSRHDPYEEKITRESKQRASSQVTTTATFRAGSAYSTASVEPIKKRGTVTVMARRGTIPGIGSKARGEPRAWTCINWNIMRPVLMTLFMCGTVYASAFFQVWDGEVEGPGPSLGSALSFGTIPVIAAIIGYGTNVAALVMMFYPLEFAGCFPRLKIGCGLDLPLFGWQGVIPMKAKEMAEVSVDLMTQKLIKVDEIFNRLDPEKVAAQVAHIMPDVLSEVIDEAGREHCPRLWEHVPLSVHNQIEDNVIADSKEMMMHFIEDLQRNINDVFDLKACAVEALVNSPQTLNDIFLVCGAEEFDFIRTSGFYLGFLFGLLQMLVWLFCRQWWILPLCGVLVGYWTNVIALGVIFRPIQPRSCCCGLFTVQGLFLKRQKAVSALYGEQIAEALLTPDVLMTALVEGPKKDAMYKLLSKTVRKCMEDQTVYYKPFFLMSNGAENWADFREGVCEGFWNQMPRLLDCIKPYLWDAIELEATLRSRLETLPPVDFERLLHSVFERDEIKLVLVGALLGAIVGMLQAIAQTPEQLGLAPIF